MPIMPKIAIVTDSTAVLSKEVANSPNVFVIPMPLIIDGKLFHEGVDLTEEEFYLKLKNCSNFPTTSQPSVGEVVAFYEQIKNNGFQTVIAIHLSSGISGFVHNLENLTAEISDLELHVFDSLITSVPMGQMVEVATRMVSAGNSATDILDYLADLRNRMKAYIIVDDLHHLVRGGRLTNGVALIGSLLNIKPILTFRDGSIVLYEKIRSLRKALKRAIELITDESLRDNFPARFFVIHSGNLKVAQTVQQKLSQAVSQPVELATFGPVIGTHLGENALGIGLIAQK